MDTPIALVAPFLSFAVLGWLIFLHWRNVRAKRRAENKVRMSDLILVSDIKILARMNSQFLDDAIALRGAQMDSLAA